MRRSVKKRICNDDLRRANERVTMLFEVGVFTTADVDALIDLEAEAVRAMNGICDRALARQLAEEAE